MADRTYRAGARMIGPLVLVVALAISGCGTSGAPPPVTSVTPSTSGTSSSATSSTSSDPTTSEPPTTSERPTTSEAPSTSTDEPGRATAQAICSAVYAGRGEAPHAESGDIDDDMALFETWHASLLEDAITQLGSSPRLEDLVAAMEEMRSLSARAALIYTEHPVFSQELSRIQERQTALADEVGRIADEAGAPMCAAVVVLP